MLAGQALAFSAGIMLKLVALAVSRRGAVICRCCAGQGSFALAR